MEAKYSWHKSFPHWVVLSPTMVFGEVSDKSKDIARAGYGGNP